MRKKRFAAALSVACALALLLFVFYPREHKFQTSVAGLFDTHITFTAYARNEREFIKYAEIVYDELEYLHRLFDAYNYYEGINNLALLNGFAGAEAVAVDGALMELLLFGRAAYDETRGTLNIALGPVTALWKAARENGTPPSADELTGAGRFTNIHDIVIDETDNTVFIRQNGMRIDVGSVAKGFAAERAMRKAEDAGLRAGLLDAGGNVTAVGSPPHGENGAWIIGILDPVKKSDGANGLIGTLSIENRSVVSSGAYERYFIADGIRYGHIIDPSTLFPADGYAGVTIIHDDSGVADMLSTALFILPVREGEALAAKWNAGAVWIFHDGTVHATEGVTIVK